MANEWFNTQALREAEHRFLNSDAALERVEVFEDHKLIHRGGCRLVDWQLCGETMERQAAAWPEIRRLMYG